MELPPPLKKYTSVSDVLTNDDLLDKILRGLGCRSCLVNAALTNKRWLHGASTLSIPDFCARHPPRLVGIYVSSIGISGSEFIHLPDASCPEVSAVSHAYFGFGNLREPNVWDCRNGVVLFEFDGETSHPARLAARAPLAHPNWDRLVVIRPPPLPPSFSECLHPMLLSTDHNDDAFCYHIGVRTWDLESNNKVMVMALVYILRRFGSWEIHCIAKGVLINSELQILPTTMLVGGKIYMATQEGYILGLELANQGFFIVDVPDAVELDYQYSDNFFHCRGDDSVLYLLHVDRDKRLNVWLRRTNDDHGGKPGDDHIASSANRWVLRDTISLCETCGHLVEEGWKPAGDRDEDAAAVVVVGAGDNADFVFLELGISGVIVYMHLRTREVKKVYQREPHDDHQIRVHPFMLIRRPNLSLPQPDAHQGEATLHQE